MTVESTVGTLIAVLDDDPGVCRSLGRLLTSRGYAVRTFTEARDYIDQCGTLGAACLVLDLRIAEVNGLRLFEETDAAGQSIPTVFITGRGDVATGVRAIKAGAVDFLEKPFDDAVLLEAVDRAIARHRATRQQSELLEVTLPRFCGLTTREAEVCTLVTAGWLNKQIAATLGIAEKTVKVHRARVMEKMRATSVAELAITVDWMFRTLQGHGRTMDLRPMAGAEPGAHRPITAGRERRAHDRARAAIHGGRTP
jgi:FixJ family two-component response regulator